MPLLEIRIEDNVRYGLWEITETQDFFFDRLQFDNEEWEYLDRVKGARKLEWLSSRWLLYLVLGESRRDPILKDDCGKPYISSQKGYISISHSHGKSAAAHSDLPVGIDIQKKVEKIYRISSKFLSEKELAQIPPERQIEHFHIFWGAKESIYKAYGRRKLDFKRDIEILPFRLEDGYAKGLLKRENVPWIFEIKFHFVSNFIVVYGMRSG
jgi:4'-phosphopantetheinyl transferase